GVIVEEVGHGNAKKAGQRLDVVDPRVRLLADGELVDVGGGHRPGMVGDGRSDLPVAVGTAVRWMYGLDQVGKLAREGLSAVAGSGHAHLLTARHRVNTSATCSR